VEFTTGSMCVRKGCRKVGVGFTIKKSGKEIRVGHLSLGLRAEVFDAEMLALALATHEAVSIAIQRDIWTISLYSDNTATIYRNSIYKYITMLLSARVYI
jgi:hypothetical protein